MIRAYKKSSLTISKLARDFLTMETGSQIPTISDYIHQFGVSRGIIQDALNLLQSDGCISLIKRGSRGSILDTKNSAKLFEYSDWNILKGTMPTPINPYLRSLATAINETMQKNQIPFCFSYIMGGERRSRLLQMEAYDFSIVSADTAAHFVNEFSDLRIALNLYPCIYSSSYALFINRPNAIGIEDGMTVCIDSSCYDQKQLSYQYAAGKNVTFVEQSAVTFEEAFNKKQFDALITRMGNWFIPCEDSTVIPIKTESDDLCPALIINKNNYKLDALLKMYLDPINLYRIQQDVLADPSKENFEA